MNVGAHIHQAVTVCFKKYADFTGRASRPEFWYWQLFILIASFVISFTVGFTGGFTGSVNPVLSLVPDLFLLAILLPSLAAGARRLHDINKSGWLQLLMLIPLIGLIIMIYFWSQPPVNENNRF
jgi:uncharacterized membrane protein YhaH (DUF805 family)